MTDTPPDEPTEPTEGDPTEEHPAATPEGDPDRGIVPDDDNDRRGGRDWAGEHPDEPDVPEQPNPDAEGDTTEQPEGEPEPEPDRPEADGDG